MKTRPDRAKLKHKALSAKAVYPHVKSKEKKKFCNMNSNTSQSSKIGRKMFLYSLNAVLQPGLKAKKSYMSRITKIICISQIFSSILTKYSHFLSCLLLLCKADTSFCNSFFFTVLGFFLILPIRLNCLFGSTPQQQAEHQSMF